MLGFATAFRVELFIGEHPATDAGLSSTSSSSQLQFLLVPPLFPCSRAQ
jgi:hypothetical protein